jgi:hypothetical protein
LIDCCPNCRAMRAEQRRVSHVRAPAFPDFLLRSTRRTACAVSKPRLVFGTAGSTTKRRVPDPLRSLQRMGHPKVCCTFGRGRKMPRFIPRGSLNQHLIRIEAPPPLSSRPSPDFLPRGTKDDLVCGFFQGKPHELCGTHSAQQEIRGGWRDLQFSYVPGTLGRGAPSASLSSRFSKDLPAPFGIQAAPARHRQRWFVLR